MLAAYIYRNSALHASNSFYVHFFCLFFSFFSFLHCRFFSLFISFACPKETNQRKGHFAEEFFAAGKNRSNAPRHFVPGSRSFSSPILHRSIAGRCPVLVTTITEIPSVTYQDTSWVET
ncbi:MAG: hypothetical protein R2793_07095 [Flavobacteriaceae bacterium]